MPEERREIVSYTLEQMGEWIELFYDLVFVAAILVFSAAVSHLHDAARIAWVVAVFSSSTWGWPGSVRARVDGPAVRSSCCGCPPR